MNDSPHSDKSQPHPDVAALHHALAAEFSLVSPAATGGALVALCGLPGTGKSHFAAALSRRLSCLVLSSDRLRKILVPQPRYTRGEHARVFRAAHALLESLLVQGYCVVFDATNLTERAREPLRDIAQRVGVPMHLVQFDAPSDLVRQRLARRSRGQAEDTYSDADWRIYCRLFPGQEPIAGPHLYVDSSQDIEPMVDRVVGLVEGGFRPSPE